jgi:hypothetical protein
MKINEFEELFQEIVTECKRKALVDKSKEYVRGDDKFHNFKRAAEVRHVHFIEAEEGMRIKHIVSILDMIDDAVKHDVYPSKELAMEKITDNIVYQMILLGMLIEGENEKIK